MAYLEAERGFRTYERVARLHALQVCVENLELIKKYLFKIKTLKVGLDCNKCEIKLFIFFNLDRYIIL